MRPTLLPDEWQSAAHAAREMFQLVRGTSHSATKHILGLLLPFMIGVGIGIWLVPHLDSHAIEVLVTGTLTLVGVLAGFIVTLMLFTGRRDGTVDLELEQAREYAAKVIYLIWSQTVTLCCLIVTAITAIAWLVANNIESSSVVQLALASCVIGGLVLSLLRIVLLPMQIYELHSFDLGAMIAEKEAALARKIDDLHR